MLLDGVYVGWTIVDAAVLRIQRGSFFCVRSLIVKSCWKNMLCHAEDTRAKIFHHLIEAKNIFNAEEIKLMYTNCKQCFTIRKLMYVRILYINYVNVIAY